MIGLLFTYLVTLTLQVEAQSQSPLLDLFIGTQGSVPGTSYNGGNVFPGASLPFGAVKVGIDTTEFNSSTDANGGYTPDGNVTAITMLHESGTGGAPTYGLIPQMPLTTLEGVNVLDNLTYMQPRDGNDSASIGRYTTKLQNGVAATISASMHAGIINYTYPNDGDRLVLVDLSHYLPTQDDPIPSQFYSNARIDVSEDGRQYSGYGVYRGGWSESPDHSVYFCSEFDNAPTSYQLFYGPYTDPYWPNTTSATATFVNSTTLTGGIPGYQYADRIGAVFTFAPNTSTVMSKTGVSWISVEKACEFLSVEISNFDLNTVEEAAIAAWNSQVFSKINITNPRNDTLLTMFNSALYRTSLLPSNRTGENPYWDDGVEYVDDIYTAWDIFRCWFSLQLLIDQPIASALTQTLISVWRHERFMPDGRSSNYNGRVQGGSNADNILADAYIKGLGVADRSINWTDGYQAIVTDAEVVPYNNFDLEDPTASTKEGRGALPDWLEYGFITPNFSRSISRTVEYSLNDFSAYQLAKTLAPNDAQKYLNRSAGWQSIWSHNTTSLGFNGFLAPTYSNKTIQPNLPNGSYTPLSCGECEWTAISYEALPWEYSWTVPFDMKSLISFMGGPNETERRLDTMFVPGLKTTAVGSGGNNGLGTTLFNPGNEPSFATPFLYNYLQGRQWKSVTRGREIVNQYYNTGPAGIPGNSDAGALDSWLVWNVLGLYPIVTQPVYLILSPWFDNVTMSVGSGKTLHITAEGLDESTGSIYVQSLRVNGQQWNQSWVSHEQLTVGQATMEFVLGKQHTQWDTGNVPPSPGHVESNM